MDFYLFPLSVKKRSKKNNNKPHNSQKPYYTTGMQIIEEPEYWEPIAKSGQ